MKLCLLAKDWAAGDPEFWRTEDGRRHDARGEDGEDSGEGH